MGLVGPHSGPVMISLYSTWSVFKNFGLVRVQILNPIYLHLGLGLGSCISDPTQTNLACISFESNSDQQNKKWLQPSLIPKIYNFSSPSLFFFIIFILWSIWDGKDFCGWPRAHLRRKNRKKWFVNKFNVKIGNALSCSESRSRIGYMIGRIILDIP